MRLTRKVFNDLALFMMAFGLTIGLVFPFFLTMLGVPQKYAFTSSFFISCILAGLIAGLVNYCIARKIVGDRLQTLSRVGQHVRYLAETIRSEHYSNAEQSDSVSPLIEDLYREKYCHVDIDSDDEFGRSAQALNLLTETLSQTISTERAARSFTNTLTSCLDLEPLANKAIKKLMLYSNSIGGLLAVFDEGNLRIAASSGISKPETVAKSVFVPGVVPDGKKQIFDSPEATIVVDLIGDEHQAKHVFVRSIFLKEVQLGVVVLVSNADFDEEILRRLDMFSVSLGLALKNSLTHGRMRKLATLDHLTGIYNRRFGVKYLHEEYTRSCRSKSSIGLIIFDIDDFKAVNDTYGHIVGDRVLVGVVKSAKQMLREGDMLIRYGGEEFMVVLPGASLNDVARIGERIRHAVENNTLLEGEHAIQVTISLGGVSYPELNLSHEEMLIHADSLLYHAKKSGKNRLELAKATHSECKK